MLSSGQQSVPQKQTVKVLGIGIPQSEKGFIRQTTRARD
jgi:hypothetical protein